jgi:acetyl-CoA carboxylase biotin carboxylase subunit
MELLGSKTAARRLAQRNGVPTVPGTVDPIESLEDATRIALEIGFPVLLKAVAGGGGKGMRLVASAAELPSAWRNAASEALNAFGDPRLYLEKYLDRPRHIEIQLLGDLHGRIVHLGERECSIQRRHQKVIEESPSPVMLAESASGASPLRRAMGEAAVRLARAGRYTNAGTIEFLVDADRNFYFLEVNTRLQVEHPVTEQVTGLDLVKLQIRIAAGDALPLRQDEVHLRGHAMECRLYAEDPENNFFPSPGKIVDRRVPSGPGIRLDDGVYAGWTVPAEYDPLLGKLIAWGNDRTETLARLRRALEEYFITGIRTNVSLFRRVLADPEFIRGEFHTRWLDERLLARREASRAEASENALEDAALLAAALWHVSRNGASAAAEPPAAEAASRWKIEGRREQLDRAPTR